MGAMRPRDDDHLIEPLYGGLGTEAPPAAPVTRPWGWWVLGVAAVGLVALWWL